MKEIIRKTVTETSEKEVGYITTCNKCGKRNEIEHNRHHGLEDGIKEFYVSFGYGSGFDGEEWSFHLCEDCLLETIKGFKHVPDGFMQDGDFLDQVEHQQVFENWKETNEWEELKFKTYGELVEMNNGWFNVEYINDAISKYHPNKPLLY